MTGNILRLMLMRGLSIVRWNNFPRVMDVTQMDNVGATLHTALFLVSLKKTEASSPIAEENGERCGEFDSLYIIKKIIFSSFSDFILSDINSETKNTIKKLDSEIYDAVYGKAYKYFLKYDMPECLTGLGKCNVLRWKKEGRGNHLCCRKSMLATKKHFQMLTYFLKCTRYICKKGEKNLLEYHTKSQVSRYFRIRKNINVIFLISFASVSRCAGINIVEIFRFRGGVIRGLSAILLILSQCLILMLLTSKF